MHNIKEDPGAGNTGAQKEDRSTRRDLHTENTVESKPTPENAEAARYLKLLDSGATFFTFQTFDDNKERKKQRKKANEQRQREGKKPLSDPFAHIIHGTLDQRWNRLAQLNADHAGIFITINETNRKGRETENIIRVRMLFVDLDGVSLDVVLNDAKFPAPHIVVESSPQRWHCYWNVTDVPLNDFAPYQKALAERFGGDPKVHDLPRVMRLPGFMHCKDKPYTSRLVSIRDAPAYKVAELFPDGIPADEAGTTKNNDNTNKSEYQKLNDEAIDNYERWVPKLFPDAKKSRKGWRMSSASLGRDNELEEALSFHPKGIKDFGVHDMGDPRDGKRSPIDIVMEWHPDLEVPIEEIANGHHTEEFDKAVAWLHEALGHKKAEPSEKPSKTQADKLIKLASTGELFHTSDGTGYVDLVVDDHRETWPIGSEGFRRWLTRCYFEKHKGAPSSDALQSALNYIEAKAHFEAPEREIYIRVGGLDGRIYIDFADEKWRAIEIDVNGWRIVGTPPVRFRRSPGMKALSVPNAGGSVLELRPFLNVATDDDFILLIAWVLATFRYGEPYPVLLLVGEGTAKSTLMRILRALIDPQRP
jgi:hypothetical protein